MFTFPEIKKILTRKTVGIAGAGGLGSNCAISLARVGIGKIILADFDNVTVKNLNRQYFFREQVGQKKVFALKDNIFFIDAKINVEAHDIRLNSENLTTVFDGCDVLVEGFDCAEMKSMFVETVITKMPWIPVILGLGIAGWGSNEAIRSWQTGNIYVCGDEQSETAENLPPLAPKVGIVANMQANTALEILLKSNGK
ncbi:MAG: sulfur carrier protein ThiS adenylyltransferase ThiF [Bacteroidales bacterium]